MQASQLYPHRAQRIELPGEHGPIAALHAKADGGAAATMLLLPGYTGSKEDFAPLLDPIAAAGFDAIAVDLPGQYESPGPPQEDEYLSAPLGALFARLIGRLTAEGQRVLLTGHSYGGLVARGAVLAGADIAGLTLLDSGPAALPDGMRRTLLEIGEPHLRDRGVHAIQELREQVAAQAPDWHRRPEELKQFMRERFVRSSQAGLLGMGAGLRTEPDRVDVLAAALRELGAGCVVAAGEHDDAWPLDQQRRMASRLGAEFTVIPNARHSPNTENPKALLDALLPVWRGWTAR